MGKISYKEKERQRREEEILQKASQLLAERGYASLNMDELADIVGISKPTLYQHFKSKEDLIANTLIHHYKTLQEEISQKLSGTPLDQMTTIMRGVYKGRFRKRSLMSTMDRETFGKFFHNHPKLTELRKQSTTGLAVLVEQAKAGGQIDPTIPTPVVIHIMFSLQSSLDEEYYGTNLANSEEALDQAIELLVRIFERAVRPEQLPGNIAN